MKKNRVLLGLGWFGLGVVATVAISIMFNFYSPRNTTIVSPEVYGETNSINQVFDALRAYHYFYEGDDQTLIDGAISGMIESLNDPHSTYFTMKDYEQFVEHLDETYSGIGCEVTSINGYTIIVSPFPEAPADLAGIMANDVVIEVDGENVVGQNVSEVTSKIKGPKGTTVKLGIQRNESSDLIYIEVTRDDIAQETVKTQIFEVEGQKIGYLQVTTFGENTANEFKNGIDNLEKEGMNSLIVDLRNNSGGYLTSVVDMVDYVLPEGKNITTIENRSNQGKTYTTSGKGKDYKIVTLINEGSASASEIFAAAMKEAGGYEIVGKTSYGKGTVQVTMPIDDHSSVKLTTQVWKTPDNNWINEVGVVPTIEVEAPEFYMFYQVYLENGKEFKYDMVDSGIVNAQKILQVLGYNIGRTDGYFDKTTESAVNQFQKDNSLDQTGVIDGNTAKILTIKLRDRVRDKQYDTQFQKALEVATQE